MDLYLIQSVNEIVLEGIPDEGLHLDDDCIIRPLVQDVREIVDKMGHYIGIANYQEIIIWGLVNFLPQQSKMALDDEQAQRLLLRSIALVDQFLLSLWIVKDNSGNMGEAHLTLVDHEREDVIPWSQRVPGLNTLADCERTTTTYSKDEVGQAIGYYRELETLLPMLEWKSKEPRPSGLVIKSRFFRAIYSAQVARRSAEIGVKIAFYCIAFEALFSTSKEAIAHQIAERAAVLMEDDRTARQAFYQDVKKVYGIRSPVVHGDALSAAKLTDFKETSRRIDERLRVTIKKIFGGPALLELFTTKSPQDIEAYFLDKLLGPTPPASAAGTTSTT